ncbi:MAG: LysM peptidoglycan-binding domain-containing protein [bacterium]
MNRQKQGKLETRNSKPKTDSFRMNGRKWRKLILLFIVSLSLLSARLTIPDEKGEYSFLWLQEKLSKLSFLHLTFDPDAHLYTLPLDDGQKAIATIQPDLQRQAEHALNLYNIKYGSIVILNPETGAVLAMASYREGNHACSLDNDRCNLANSLALRSRHPAASIFKVITAAAALEEGVAGPESPFYCRGSLIDRNHGCLLSDPKYVRHGEIDLSLALAKSCNVTFGKVAALLGPSSLKEYTRKFGFDEPLEFDLSVESSRATIPYNLKGLARAGAGFGEVMLSPLQGALIAATVANYGQMVRPCLFAEVRDNTGKLLFQHQPQVMRRPIKVETAFHLSRMMQKTVTEGTARRSFYRHGQPVLPVEAAGKTGTLTGGNPRGICTWFIGYAPVINPQVAISVMVVNHSNNGTKATRIASRVLASYFKVDTIPEKIYVKTTPEKRYHVVRRGETLWKIAGKYGVSLKTLKGANRLRSNSLRAGQKLVIPGAAGHSIASTAGSPEPEVAPSSSGYDSVSSSPPAVRQKVAASSSQAPLQSASTHVVKRGESLWEIAKKYGVSWKALKHANNLCSNRLRAGQKLTIPNSNPSISSYHIVERGQSLWEIANKYGVSVKTLKQANYLRSNRLRVGQKLTIPDSSASIPGYHNGESL